MRDRVAAHVGAVEGQTPLVALAAQGGDGPGVGEEPGGDDLDRRPFLGRGDPAVADPVRQVPVERPGGGA
ncbi:hypothetical protein ACZ90_54160 [Streptomyces albus subsp. albus]|nr:hypothetical protein ACZ90_54160 [Streptomyces albus subsp. albus]